MMVSRFVKIEDVEKMIGQEIKELLIMMKDDRQGAEAYSHEISALRILAKRLKYLEQYHFCYTRKDKILASTIFSEKERSQGRTSPV